VTSNPDPREQKIKLSHTSRVPNCSTFVQFLIKLERERKEEKTVEILPMPRFMKAAGNLLLTLNKNSFIPAKKF
jgi:hypothetical protein